jgi:hypothetical protein
MKEVIMTITRALVELKMAEKKITQLFDKQFVGLYQNKSKSIINTAKIREDFETEAKSNIDSLKSLLDNAAKLRCGLALANATNKVEICGREYAVAEALVYKNRVIPLYKQVISALKAKPAMLIQEIEQTRVRLEGQVEDMLKQNLGNDRKADKDAYDAIAKPLFDANELHLSDAGKTVEYADSLQEYIDGFLTEVDVVLAESNARIEI